MVVRDPIPWQEIYARFAALESEMRELRALLLTLQPAEAIICRNPIPLGGWWASVGIGDDLIAAARNSMFPYEHKPLEI